MWFNDRYVEITRSQGKPNDNDPFGSFGYGYGLRCFLKLSTRIMPKTLKQSETLNPSKPWILKPKVKLARYSQCFHSSSGNKYMILSGYVGGWPQTGWRMENMPEWCQQAPKMLRSSVAGYLGELPRLPANSAVYCCVCLSWHKKIHPAQPNPPRAPPESSYWQRKCHSREEPTHSP